MTEPDHSEVESCNYSVFEGKEDFVGFPNSDCVIAPYIGSCPDLVQRLIEGFFSSILWAHF